MKNIFPMFRYSSFEMIEKEVPTSHHKFGYAMCLNMKIQLFHPKLPIFSFCGIEIATFLSVI